MTIPNKMLELLYALTSGSYIYTFLATKNVSRKSDIDILQKRVDEIYKILLDMKDKK